MRRTHRRTRRRLTQSERVAVDTYHNLHESEMGMVMNKYVRVRDSNNTCSKREMHDVLRRLVADLDTAFQKAPHLPPSPSSSSTSLSHIDLYRGMSGDVAKRLRRTWTRPGSTHRLDGFVSTSFVPLSALFYTRGPAGILLHIHLTPTTLSLPFLYAHRETEVTLPRDITWKLIERKEVNTEEFSACPPAGWHPSNTETEYRRLGIVPDTILCFRVEPCRLGNI